MKEYQYFIIEIEDHVATVTINNPKALNALSSPVVVEMISVIEELSAMKDVRCVILTGAGEKSFVAGADIGEMSTLTKAEGEAFGKKGNDIFRAIETFPIPVIAAVNGPSANLTVRKIQALSIIHIPVDHYPLLIEGQHFPAPVDKQDI